MKLRYTVLGLQQKVNIALAYPAGSMVLALLLILLSPFVSAYLCYAAFLICIYRVVRYSAQVFLADYALLLPLTQVFCTPDGMSLLVYLSLFASAWYLIRGSLRANSTVVWFLLLLTYMLARMQLDVARYLLSFGQIFLLYVLLPRQSSASAVRAAKLFCIGLAASSLFALLLRDTWQLRSIIGEESAAIWGTNIMRFRGLVRDPNYYMTMLVVSLALLLKLWDHGQMGSLTFWILAVPTVGFGILTYSKTFFLLFILLGGFYILWQFSRRRLIWASVLTILAVAAMAVLLLSESSPFAVVLSRFSSASTLDELTTGRTAVYTDYLEIILHDPLSFLFGQGLAAEGLVKDPHNLYIELLYYVGAVGLILYFGFCAAMIHSLKKQCFPMDQGNIFGKYIVLFSIVLLFFTLHGIFQPVIGGDILLAVLSVLIPVKRAQLPPDAEGAVDYA